MKYVVELEEILSRHIIVDAESSKEAINKVETLYENGNICVDDRDYNGIRLNFCRQATNDDINRYGVYE